MNVEALRGAVSLLQEWKDFESFHSPGQRYLDEERTYKLDASAAVKARFSPVILRDELDRQDYDALRHRLAEFVSTRGFANLLDWRDVNTLLSPLAQDPERTPQLVRLIEALIAFQQPGADVEACADEMATAMADGLEGAQKSFPWTNVSYFCAMLDPARCLFVKPRAFDHFTKWLGISWRRPTQFSGAGYGEVLAQADAIAKALADIGCAPNDMIDVQSLYWVVYPARGTSPQWHLARMAAQELMARHPEGITDTELFSYMDERFPRPDQKAWHPGMVPTKDYAVWEDTLESCGRDTAGYPKFLLRVRDSVPNRHKFWTPGQRRAVASKTPATVQPVVPVPAAKLAGYEEPPFHVVAEAIARRGLMLSDLLLRRYHLALKSRRFVILSGISGTGKSWLASAYAEAVSARHLLVPVAPNWTSNEDLLGYFNPLDGRYYDTAFSRFLREAAREYETVCDQGGVPAPYHLILDEMNLARVEHYFAKFLSALEVLARDGVATLELGPDDTIHLPPTLHVIGTVNMDETTHGFADKVHDRAQLIEMGIDREALARHLGDAPYKASLLEIWEAVRPAASFAFRVADDIAAYVAEAEKLEVDWEEALDEQVLHKVLPKLRGSDVRVGEALERLLRLSDGTLPHTHAKVRSMSEGYTQHGFASFF